MNIELKKIGYVYFFRLLIFLLPTVICEISYAQDKSNKGKEFWLGYGHNVLFTQDPPINSQTHVLYLSTESQAATVTVSVNGTTWSQTVSIPANTVNFSITIPKTGPEDARLTSEGLSTKGIHIVSDVPIVTYSHQYGLLSSAATMLMPVETYGYTYYSLNYTQVSNYVDSYSWFFVVAAENNTRLLITPSDSTQGGWIGGQTYTVNLNKGEIYNVFGKKTGNLSTKDMTGSKIVSVAGGDGNCHPVAVFSGSSRNTVCNGNGGEVMQQQIFPASAWGSKYVTYQTINNTGGILTTPFLNIYRVAVRNPATIVKRNGIPLTGLNRNFYYEFQSNSGDIIEADAPIMVAQFTVSSNECSGTNANPLGDPEMIYLSPIEQGVKKAVFYSTRNQAISLNFINLIIPTAGIASLLIDGTAPAAAEMLPHPQNPAYTVVGRRLLGAAAQHTVSSDSSFTATAYGVGNLESYGYNVGTLVNNLNASSSIKNTFNSTGIRDTFTCPKSPFRLYIQLAYKATSISWNISSVIGLQPSADSTINNPVPIDSVYVNGRKFYRYTLQQDYTLTTPGTYQIPFTYSAPDIDACNQTETGNITVVVKPGPSADFTISAARCLSDSIYFSGSANIGNFTFSQYLWTFSDATTSTNQNVAKKFTTAGNQPVRFQVIATNGCVADTTKTIVINDAPLAKFGVTGLLCSGDSLRISDSTTITSGTITTRRWDMGNGTIINTNSNLPFNYAYPNAGNYIIKLIAASANGCNSDTAYKTVVVQQKPTALFGFDRNICLGDSIRFSDSSFTSNGLLTNRNWSFGDGTNVSLTSSIPFFHTYNSANNFLVKLVVQSSNGCISDTAVKTVIVAAKPVANISISGTACIDSIRRFTSTYASGPAGTNWWWSFGDGQTLNAPINTANHSYSSAATNITVKHVVNIGQGCASDTATLVIPAIYPNPTTTLTVVADTLCTGSRIVFNADTTGIAIWQWNFGNGSSTATPPVTRSYTNAGNYTVSLKVKNSYGCGSATVSSPLTIYAPPSINAGPDKYIKPGDMTTLDAVVSNPSAHSFLWTPALHLSSPTSLNPVASPDTTTQYTIFVLDNTSKCSASDKVIVNVFNGLYIPNAFTPNNDGKNDRWQIPGLAAYPDAVVSVFDRWGTLIYQAKNYTNNPWDGKRKGLDTEGTGTYIYTIQLNDSARQAFKGTLLLIR